MKTMTIALLQAAPVSRSFTDVLADLEIALQAAAAQKADILVTPELFVCGYGEQDRAIDMAVSQTDPFMHKISDLVQTHGVGLVLGYSEQAGPQRYNSAAYFESSGQLANNYRKQFLPCAYEKDCFSTGSETSVFRIGDIPCAILICYDIEFPETARKAALAGASVLLIPTALNATWRIVSDVVIPTRAYENGIFVAYCDFAASEQGANFSGLSKICGPEGHDRVRGNYAPGLLCATIDLDDITVMREHFHMLRDITALDASVNRHVTA
ncbi:MAG: hydrolase [Alphaproteobacteria bacterium]|nr:hydrolase [Alphaproteobacteria bacterium]